MKLALPTFVLALTLTACGGGGGGGTTGGGGSALPPTPTSSSTPQLTSVSGKVVQLAGQLSSSTWNLAAPTGCSGGGCTSYPTPPASLPSATATPAAGVGVGGATVYAVANADIAGVPASPIAQATTAPDGSFSLTLPTGTASVGLIALYGASYNAQTGASSTGYTLGHATVAVGSQATLYVDQLSADEQSAITALNSDRAAANAAALSTDTMAQAVARLAAAQQPGSSTCDNPSLVASYSSYKAWGGVGASNSSWGDTGGPYWAKIVQYGSTAWSQPGTFVGLAALYQATKCGPYTIPVNYFEGIYLK